MKKDKRAWIRIVEAFVAILLITGVLLLVINERYIEKRDIYPQIYSREISILREIQLDDNFRDIILNVNLPTSWIDEAFPEELKNKILNGVPSNLDCAAKICEINDICTLEELSEEIVENIYAESIIITANLTRYSPRKLKLFCWFR